MTEKLSRRILLFRLYILIVRKWLDCWLNWMIPLGTHPWTKGKGCLGSFWGWIRARKIFGLYNDAELSVEQEHEGGRGMSELSLWMS